MRIFGGISKLPKQVSDRLLGGSALTPNHVLEAKTIPDLLKAYFKGEEKLSAYGLMSGMTALSLAIGFNGIQTGIQAARTMGARADFTDPDIVSPLANYNYQLNWLIGMAAAQTGLVVARHILSSNFHRKASGWVTGKLSSALNGAALHITQNMAEEKSEDKKKEKDPNSPSEIARTSDKTVTDNVKDLFGGATGLYMGTLTAAFGLIIAGNELAKMTKPVEGLEMFGEYGVAAYAAGIATLAVGSGTYGAWKIGNFIAKATSNLMQTEGEYRIYARNKMANAFHIAANGGRYLQEFLHKKTYDRFDHAWYKKNYVQAGYMGFKGIYDPLINNWLVFIPGLGPLSTGAINFEQYLAVSGVIAAAWNKVDLLIDVMPAARDTEANGKRILNLIKYIRDVEDPQAFYNKSGVSDFVYKTHDPKLGFVVQNLEMMHKGKDAEPFIAAKNIVLRPGDWASLEGPSGCGKSHVLKAMAGESREGRKNEPQRFLNPYGRATIVTGEGQKVFYVPQDTVFEPVSLKDLISYPSSEEEKFSDREVKSVMKLVGLEKYVDCIHEDMHDGEAWQDILSGGERKKVMAARAFLKNADVYLMDEITSGLDPASADNFYRTMKKLHPEAIVCCIMHEKDPPILPNGDPIFNVQLKTEDGVIRQNNATMFTRHLRVPQQTGGHRVNNAFQGPPIQ